MCTICCPGQIKLVTPMRDIEVSRMCDRCDCGRSVIIIERMNFPSLIQSWKILTPESYECDQIPNIVHNVRIIVDHPRILARKN